MSNVVEMKQQKLPEAKFIEVTPAMAARFLKGNEGNRSISNPKVASYAGQMKRGTFKGLNGESASIDWNGKIHNGQHRFLAIIKSGKTIPMLVVFNVDPSTFATVDDVRKRSAQDVFTIEGFTTSQAKALPIAASLEIAMRLGATRFAVPAYIGYLTTPTETMKLVEEDKSFVETLASLKGIVKARGSLLSLANATFLVRRMRLCDAEGTMHEGFTDGWLPQLFSGEMLGSEPRMHVRRVIEEAENKRTVANISQGDRMAMITKAWWSDRAKNPQKSKSGYIPPIKNATKWLQLEDDDLDGLHKIRMDLKGEAK